MFVEGGGAIVGAINDEIERTTLRGGTVVLTQDWHPASTSHFIEDGGVWPTHCVAGTWGAALGDDTGPAFSPSSNTTVPALWAPSDLSDRACGSRVSQRR